jgi:hypothetical protein
VWGGPTLRHTSHLQIPPKKRKSLFTIVDKMNATCVFSRMALQGSMQHIGVEDIELMIIINNKNMFFQA